jgi:gamma-glutamylcysteine synthetase
MSFQCNILLQTKINLKIDSLVSYAELWEQFSNINQGVETRVVDPDTDLDWMTYGSDPNSEPVSCIRIQRKEK